VAGGSSRSLWAAEARVFRPVGFGGWFLCPADNVGPGWAGGGAVMLEFR
jgi:hypothetical protein